MNRAIHLKVEDSRDFHHAHGKQCVSLDMEVSVIIIHSGANHSFWDYYQQLRLLDLASTKKLVRLASSRKIPIHFISSGGVLQLSDNITNATSMASCNSPVDGCMGYVAFKWSSEPYFEDASKALGIPVHTQRADPRPRTIPLRSSNSPT